jgi:UDPglucose 6-dehydrogenase
MSDHTDRYSIGIIGGGFVGGAAKQYFKNAKVYDTDPKRANASMDEVCAQDYIFVTVPTPQGDDGKVDLSIVESVLSEIPDGKKIVLKSTAVPGTTERLQEKYPNKIMCYVPEFLTAKFAAEDFSFPDKNIVGATSKYPEFGDEVARILPKATTLVCKATEAEMIKYMLNSYYALKVTYSNEVYDLCQKLDIDYNVVKEGFVLDKRVNDSHFDVMNGFKRGFGGACLTKDTSAIVKRAEELGVDFGLVRSAIELNKKYREMETVRKSNQIIDSSETE